jgi:hypothetical protein
MSMTCTLWKPMRRNSLLGFATVAMSSGLVLHEIAINTSRGAIWAAPPAKPRLDKDGRQILLDGKRQWDQVVSFRSKALRDTWSAQVVAAVERAYPDAFTEESAA